MVLFPSRSLRLLKAFFGLFLGLLGPMAEAATHAENLALGEQHLEAGELLQAGAVWREGLQVARQDQDAVAEGEYLVRLGAWQRQLGDLAQSVRHYLEALEVVPGAAVDLRARAHRGLATVYGSAGDQEAAFRHFSEAADLARALGDQRQFVEARIGAAAALRDLGEAVQALAPMEEAVAEAETLGDPVLLASALNNYGVLLGDSGRWTEAIGLHQRAQHYAREAGLGYQTALALYHRGKNLRRLGDPEAGAALEAAYQEGDQQGEIRIQRWSAWELSRWLEAQGDAAAALLWQRRYERHRTAMERRAGAGRLSELELRQQLASQERLLEAQRQKATQTAAALEQVREERLWWATLTLAGILVLGAIAFALAVRRRAVRRILDETRRARDEAARTDALKSELLRVASHDLKNPLGNVLLSTEALLESPLDPESRELVELMAAEANRMADLVRELLDHAALELGRLELRLEPVDVRALALEMASIFRPRTAAKGQRIVVSGAGGVISADRNRLLQIVENLVSNALKFGPAHSTVTIEVDPVPGGQGLRLAVRDAGPGLTTEDREALFAPFRRLSARPTGRETSTGMGLAIVEQLVRLHGGSVGVESEPGQGTTFVVKLPLEPPAACPGGKTD